MIDRVISMIGDAKNQLIGRPLQGPIKRKQTSNRLDLLKVRSVNSCKDIKRDIGLVFQESRNKPVKNMVCSYTMENMLRNHFYSEKDCRRLRDLLSVPTPPFSSSLLPPKIPALNPARILSPDQLVRLEAINRDKKLYEEKRLEERKAQKLIVTQQLREVHFKRDEIRAIMKKNQASQRSKFEVSQAAKSAVCTEQEDHLVTPMKLDASKRGLGHRTASMPMAKQQSLALAKDDDRKKGSTVNKCFVGDSTTAGQSAGRERVQSTTSILHKHQRLHPHNSLNFLRSAPISRSNSTQKKRMQLPSPEIKFYCKEEPARCAPNRNGKETTTTDITQTSSKKPKDFELIEESFDSNYIVRLRPRGFDCNPHTAV